MSDGIKVLITKQEQVTLTKLGYNDDDIYRMSPVEAADILALSLEKSERRHRPTSKPSR